MYVHNSQLNLKLSEKYVYIQIYMYIYIFVYMKVAQNSFLSDRPFLAKKVFTLAKLSPFPQKTFAGSYSGL